MRGKFTTYKNPVPLFNNGSPLTKKRKFAMFPLSVSICTLGSP